MNAHKKEIGICVVAGLLFIFFGYYCPVSWILGIPCPGCNMTTALVHLLKLDLHSSLFFHALCIPTICTAGFLLYLYYKGYTTWIERIVWVWALCMILYYIYRMIFVFPQYPMEINHNALLSQLR
ncbi:MAG: DUF2752 domain-containing protein [Firmicutes bacterium]|nr:DUF2752 domain-containing protein [Bacillota bacterium]